MVNLCIFPVFSPAQYSLPPWPARTRGGEEHVAQRVPAEPDKQNPTVHSLSLWGFKQLCQIKHKFHGLWALWPTVALVPCAELLSGFDESLVLFDFFFLCPANGENNDEL